MASHRRGPWSQGEDAYLCQLVHTQGALNWVRIAQLIGSRSPKQCRERYHQNLKPTLNHEPISPEEGLQIERMVAEMGKRWAEIARRLHGRSDNAVKNWWNGSMNRRRRLVLRRKASSPHSTHFEERDQSLSFPKPASNRPLTITSSTFTPRHGMDGPLPSPAVSEASRAESVDGAPSLVSDTSSAFSISPRLGTSPGLELPPLNCYSHESRRPSLPGLPMRPNTFFTEPDTLNFTLSSRFQGDAKAHSLNTLSPIYSPSNQQSHHESPSSPREHHFDSRRQLLTAPPTPVQLPPLQFGSRFEGAEQAAERDSRMRMSSLLG